MSDLLEVVLRPAGPSDIGYVIDRWGRSLREEYPDARTTDFVAAIRAGIGRRLNAGARLVVASPVGFPDVLYGWICETAGVVNYIFVDSDYRRSGIARKLVESIYHTRPIYVDAMTDDARAIKRKHPDLIRYFPNV